MVCFFKKVQNPRFHFAIVTNRLAWKTIQNELEERTERTNFTRL